MNRLSSGPAATLMLAKSFGSILRRIAGTAAGARSFHRRVGDEGFDLVIGERINEVRLDVADFQRKRSGPSCICTLAQRVGCLFCVSEAAKPHAALGQGFRQFDRRIVATAIGDMEAKRLKFRCERLHKHRPDESDFSDTFGNNR